jgi:hypothetical protein
MMGAGCTGRLAKGDDRPVYRRPAQTDSWRFECRRRTLMAKRMHSFSGGWRLIDTAPIDQDVGCTERLAAPLLAVLTRQRKED